MIIAWLTARMWPLLAIAALLAGGIWYHHHVYHQGELAADARAAVREAANSARAKQERITLNARIAAVQAQLAVARVDLAKLKQDNENDKAISTERQRRLLADNERMRILTRVRSSCPNGSPGGTPTGGLDQESAVEADIDPRVSGWLEGVRADHNGAIKRLDACIVAYGALKSAVDAMP